MSAIERAQAGVRRIMERFPSVTVTLKRPALDVYGQPTGALATVAECRVWTEGMNRPGGYRRENSGLTFDDEGAVWVALLAQDAPEARHGDAVEFPGGSTRHILNIYRQGADTRTFWQLE